MQVSVGPPGRRRFGVRAVSGERRKRLQTGPMLPNDELIRARAMGEACLNSADV